MWTKADIDETVKKDRIVVFCKGTKDQPMCGFTQRAIAILQQAGQPFRVVNIFDDPSIRPALVEYTEWPTTPQIFVGGEFVGGSDTALGMYESGELQQRVRACFGS